MPDIPARLATGRDEPAPYGPCLLGRDERSRGFEKLVERRARPVVLVGALEPHDASRVDE